MKPNWELVRAVNITAVIICIPLLYLAGPSWFGMFDATLVGCNLWSAMWITRSTIPMERAFEQMAAAFEEMADLNDALIHDRVMFHLYGESTPLEPVDDHKPRLH